MAPNLQWALEYLWNQMQLTNKIQKNSRKLLAKWLSVIGNVYVFVVEFETAQG